LARHCADGDALEEGLPRTMTSLISVAFAVYLVVIGFYIISENRRPSATFAWMLLFAFLPGIGVIVYLLFGRKHQDFGHTGMLMRQELAERLEPVLAVVQQEHQRTVELMHDQRTPAASLPELVRNTSRSAVTARNEVELLQNAAESYPSLIADLKAARRTIHLQYFSWNTDELA
jgi:cardiolipin synthase A/B